MDLITLEAQSERAVIVPAGGAEHLTEVEVDLG